MKEETIEEIKIYNPNNLPPDPKIALLHYEATKVGIPPKIKDETNTCPCCLNSIKEDFDIFKSGKGIKQFGNTIPLYFQFTNFVLIYFVIMTVGNIRIIILTTILCYEFETKDLAKDLSFFQILSLLYDRSPMFYKKKGQELLNLEYKDFPSQIFTIFCLIIFSFYYQFEFKRYLVKKKYKMKISASDYTIMIGNVKESDSKKKLEEFLENVAIENNIPKPRVVKISKGAFRGKIQLIQQKIEEKSQEIQAIRNFLNSGEFCNESLKIGEDAIKAKEKKIEKYEKQKFHLLKKDISMESNTDNCVAFVTLATVDQKNLILSCRKKLSCWIFRALKHPKDKEFKILKAPNPDDVKWENIGYSTWRRKRSTIIGVFFSFLTLPLFFIAMFNITIFRVQLSIEFKNNIIYLFIINFLISPLSIQLSQYIFIKLIGYFSKRYKYLSVNKFLSSNHSSVTFVYITNFYLTLFAAFSSIYKKEKTSESDLDSLGRSVFDEEAFKYFLSKGILLPFLSFLNLKYYYEKYLKKQSREKLMNNSLKINGKYTKLSKYHFMTQKEFNEFNDRSEINISYLYFNMIGQLLAISISIYFCLLTPIQGIIFVLVQRFVDKYLMIRRDKIPIENSEILSKSMMNLIIGLVPRIYFYYWFRNYGIYHLSKGGIFKVILILVAIGYCLLPSHTFFSYLLEKKFRQDKMDELEKNKFKKKEDDLSEDLISDEEKKLRYGIAKNLEYEQVEHFFASDYERENPITRKEAEKTWKQNKREVLGISDSIF